MNCLLINCESDLDLNWSKNCVPVANNEDQATTFSITDTKLYVPVVTLSTQDNTKLLEQLKSGFERTINCNKYQSKRSIEISTQYLDYWLGPSFQRVNRLFAWSFEDETQRTSYKRYYLLTVEIKNYDVMINGQHFFDQPVRNDLITYDSIGKIATSQGNDYTTGYLLDNIYFEKYYKMIAIGLGKRQAFNADLEAT